MFNRPALQVQYSDYRPNELVRSVGHHRMPVLLTSEDEYSAWLNPEAVEREMLEPLMRTVPVAGWVCYRGEGEGASPEPKAILGGGLVSVSGRISG
jgi:putative SOS response-associated peptidase YedK